MYVLSNNVFFLYLISEERGQLIRVRGRRKEDGKQGTDQVRQGTKDGRQGTET